MNSIDGKPVRCDWTPLVAAPDEILSRPRSFTRLALGRRLSHPPGTRGAELVEIIPLGMLTSKEDMDYGG